MKVEQTKLDGVLRGLHYQAPQWQGKLVRVIQGDIFDVVGIHHNSPTYGGRDGENDPDIDWSIDSPLLSGKDKNAQRLVGLLNMSV